ncbi:MAG: type IX secretion system membrane protein PorP/SprF [Bacteroidales bacterium]
MKRPVYILLFLLISNLAVSQQLPVYSQYLANKFLINPAVAGSDGYTTLTLAAREQWVGYYGAPNTFSFAGQGRILKKGISFRRYGSGKKAYRPKSDGRVGVGGYIFSDKNGIVQRTGFQIAYSYHLWLQRSTQLSLGLAFTGYNFKIDQSQINFENPNDPWLNNNLRSGIFVPDAMFGAYILNPKYSLGFSVDELFEGAAKFGDYAYKNYELDRHYYLFGTYYIELNNYMNLQPSFLFVMSEELLPMADIGMNYFYNNKFWVGLAYRTSEAIIAHAGVRYQNITFGYSFDFTLSEIQRVTYGTHELTIALKFGDSARKYRWLDRY